MSSSARALAPGVPWLHSKRASDYAGPAAVDAQAAGYSASTLFSVDATTIAKADTGEAVLSLQLAPNRDKNKS